jgi:drug/metabolite transporter (DMT)-like permease
MIALVRMHYRFGEVLALILLSLSVQLAAPDGDVARLIVIVLQGVTLFVAVYASRAHPWVIRITGIASALLVLGGVTAVVGSNELGEDSSRAVTLLLVGLASPAIVTGLVRHFRDEGRVTMQTMFGVLCLYLLIGMFFGMCFATMEELGNEEFFTSGAAQTTDFLYFSFATLTTTGYGDLIAATDLGRSLAITEALIGQIYLVTVVALIVGNLGPRTDSA